MSIWQKTHNFSKYILLISRVIKLSNAMPQDVLKARYLNELKKKYDKFMEYKSGTIKTVMPDFVLQFENFQRH